MEDAFFSHETRGGGGIETVSEKTRAEDFYKLVRGGNENGFGKGGGGVRGQSQSCVWDELIRRENRGLRNYLFSIYRETYDSTDIFHTPITTPARGEAG